MNGGVATAVNGKHQPTGSKKRKRGLAPRKTMEVATTVVTPMDSESSKAHIKEQTATTATTTTIENDLKSLSVPQLNGHHDGSTTPTLDELNLLDEQPAEMHCCSLCGQSKPHAMIDLSSNAEIKRTLNKHLKVPSQSLNSEIDTMCVQCIYKINARTEITRSVKIRLQRLTNGQIKNHNNPMKDESIVALNEAAALTPLPPTRITTPPPTLPPQTSHIDGLNSSTISEPELNAIINPATTPTKQGNSKTDAPLDLSIRTPQHSPQHQQSCNSATILENQEQHSRTAYVVQVEDITPVITPEKSVGTNDSSPETLLFENKSKSPPLPQISPALIKKSIVRPIAAVIRPLNAPSNTSSQQSLLLGELPHNSSMLEVYCEHSESALVTESGGKINNYRRVRSLPQQMVCQRCSRAYWRKDYYAKHMRHCNARHRNATSKTTATSLRSTKSIGGIDDNDDVTKSSEENENVLMLTAVPAVRPRVFHCSECAVTVENITKLREHKRIHLKRFYCETCGAEFTTMHNFEFHRMECEARQEVLQSKRPEMAKSLSTTPITTGRMTRARSRAISKAATCLNTRLSDASSIYRENTTKAYNKDDFDDDNDDNVDDNDEDNDDDDDVSVADTMYTKRMRFTDNWVVDHSSSNSYLSLCDNNLYDCDEDLQISTYKEYDLYLLDRFKAELNANAFTCFVPECDYHANGLDALYEIMLHDYSFHFKKPWFYCKKCGGIFTSKVYLDYHLDCQNHGRFICFKCGDYFEYQHQLDRHLLRHTKCINYRCNYCKFEFLTKNELLQHCDIEQHDPNGERWYICIDPTMTIVNEVPPPQIYRRGNQYSVRIIDMRLPCTPSKRPMQLPNHKPYRRFLGDMRFKNQTNPNCWGWKSA